MLTIRKVGNVLDRLATIAILCGIAIWGVLYTASMGPFANSSVSEAVEEIDQVVELRDPEDAAAGSQLAKVVVLEFSDFECPYCSRHATEVLPTLKREFVDNGKVRYVFRHFPLETIHPYAGHAAAAAVCGAKQGKFWEVHDRLFENQEMLRAGKIVDAMAGSELAFSELNECLEEFGPSRVAEDREQGIRLQVNATPTLFVGQVKNGKVHLSTRINGAANLGELRKVLSEALDRVE
jgi:protein-disulfide isomerase